MKYHAFISYSYADKAWAEWVAVRGGDIRDTDGLDERAGGEAGIE